MLIGFGLVLIGGKRLDIAICRGCLASQARANLLAPVVFGR